MTRLKINTIGLALLIILMSSCGTDSKPDPTNPNDDFDRNTMLTVWADESIMPEYTAFNRSLDTLETSLTRFLEITDETNLVALRAAFKKSYLKWQRVSMFAIGKAEEISFRSKMNTFPADIELIEELKQMDEINLDLPSNFSAQGFPALDYLFYGLADSDSEIVQQYIDDENRKNYVRSLLSRMRSLSQEVLLDWEAGYRDVFISADGNSATASVDRFVNDYIFYYEKFLRAGKVGIPAGVFSVTALPDNVESIYSAECSKDLLVESFNACTDFFEGRYLNANNRAASLAGYLDHLSISREGMPLSDVIMNQFRVADDKISALRSNLKEQVNMDNVLMLETYDALQLNVIYMKVDMLQALNINVDFVDADGD